MPAGPGRPTGYTEELANLVCSLLETGATLKSICRENDVLPAEATVRLWAKTHKDFAARYAEARDTGLTSMADELIDIADNRAIGDFPDRRLMVDTRKWYLAKLAPKRYSDRLLQEHSGPDGGPLQINITNTDSEL